jgi:hypothetical protein
MVDTQVMTLTLIPDVGLQFPDVTEICRLMGFDAGMLRSLELKMGVDGLTTAVVEFYDESPVIPVEGFTWQANG